MQNQNQFQQNNQDQGQLRMNQDQNSNSYTQNQFRFKSIADQNPGQQPRQGSRGQRQNNRKQEKKINQDEAFSNISKEVKDKILKEDKNALAMLNQQKKEQLKIPQQKKAYAEAKTEKEIVEQRNKLLKEIREDELKADKYAEFDHLILRDRLKSNTPLQKLFEAVYFDDYDLFKALYQQDIQNDGTVGQKEFKLQILRDIPSIDPFQEIDLLIIVAPRTSVGESRILYKALSNELRDLAKLRIPLNLLYQRHKYIIPTLPATDLTNEEDQKKHDMESLFEYKDPRLRHLNKNFSREELQVRNLDFVNDKVGFKAAIDEIIKFNCQVNEFNYMHDLFQRMNKLLIEKTVSYDWIKLFDLYDKDLKKNILEKSEIKKIMVDAGFTEVTDREAQFAYNVISRFTYKIDRAQFMAWIDVIFINFQNDYQSMIGKPKLQLIYYSQYIDPATMRITSAEELKLRSEKESKFYKAIKGLDFKAIEDRVPMAIQFIANEINLLGDQFFLHTLEKNAAADETGRILIEFTQLVLVFAKFQYLCNKEDRLELRVWLFNKNLFMNTPKFYQQDLIFLDVENLMECLKEQATSQIKNKESSKTEFTMDSIFSNLRQNILDSQINKAIDALNVFKIEGEIGEREFRKILNQCLPGVTLHQQHCIVESIKTFKPADDIYMFRRFKIDEIVSQLEKIKTLQGIQELNLEQQKTESLKQQKSPQKLFDQSFNQRQSGEDVFRQSTTQVFNNPRGELTDLDYELLDQREEIDEFQDGDDNIFKKTAKGSNLLKYQMTQDFQFNSTGQDQNPYSETYREQRADQILKQKQTEKEKQKTYINHPGVKGKVYNAQEFSPIKMHTHKAPKKKGDKRNETEMLNSIFDKIFEFAKVKSEAEKYGYFEKKLRLMIDYIANAFDQIDLKQTGHFYCWELKDYLINEKHGLLFGIDLTDEEVDAFIFYAAKVTGIDFAEKDNILSVKIKHSFLLAQLEQNFYIRFDFK
ncbi:UNKNOWN [Stylonychia lemnae]|uniref:EF-hand domain-containing protein n=1 Tax=Stylonychia lemnae TaxID=5949 RepID=A0A077ZW71_STYLE|nr:UNKNOWN [Stylonychia lemnae]|eukprot:CDW73821.1 UNKNOWN [Stylonychia lemnae]